jgi:phytoene dehydrogenase-like protein
VDDSLDYDVIVIGAGHNGLISAAYLAKAGYRVGVFERRALVGGAVSTDEVIPGYQFDLGGSAHILIHLTPVVEELELEAFGLEYLDLDPLFFAPFHDDDSFFIYRDVDRTVAHLEERYPGEGEAYRRFYSDWHPFSMGVRDAFLSVPGPLQLGKSMLLASSPLHWQTKLQRILKPYGHVVSDYFREEKIRSALVWMAAQSGPPPGEPVTGPFVLWHPLYHESGIKRPRGGSGMLTVALRRAIEAAGGEVHVNAAVSEILCKGSGAEGVRVGKAIYTARAVIAATHAVETFDRLLPEHHRPPERLSMRVGNGFGAMLRLALKAPVKYRASEDAGSRRGLQLLCENRHQIDAAYGDFLRGEPAKKPPLVAMTFSAVDPSLAPAGHEVLWLWGQYYPYELSGGKRWDEIEDDVVDSILDTFEAYAPGTRGNIVGQLFQHPEWLERELGLYRGNVMHLEMSIDQMFGMRPFMGMAKYRTHLRRLYLTGASTHPGGGIMGASGRNTARVVLKDLEKRRI